MHSILKYSCVQCGKRIENQFKLSIGSLYQNSGNLAVYNRTDHTLEVGSAILMFSMQWTVSNWFILFLQAKRAEGKGPSWSNAGKITPPPPSQHTKALSHT